MPFFHALQDQGVAAGIATSVGFTAVS